MDKADIVATIGHLQSNPSQLSPLGLEFRDDGHGRRRLAETMRGPRRQNVFDFVQAAAADRREVYIATDPDFEGHAIALDVARAILPVAKGASFKRVALRSIDAEGVRQAFAGARKFEPMQARIAAVPSRTRAIVDRLLGWSYSGKGLAAGRVSSALLSTVANRMPSIGTVTFRLPADDWGRDFVAEVPVHSVAEGERLDQMCRLFAQEVTRRGLMATPSPEKTALPPAKPLHMGSLMLQASKRLDISLEGIYDIIQELYQDGKLTYPRSALESVNDAGLKVAADIAARAGVTDFSEGDAARYRLEEDSDIDVHEAPRAVNAVEVAALLGRRRDTMSKSEVVLALVGESMVAIGRPIVEERVDMRSLADKGLPQQILSLPWVRRTAGSGPLPWEKEPEIGFRRDRPDAIALRVMLQVGLGRPSTWVDHATRFVGRDLVDHDFRPTPKGRAWLGRLPAELKKVKVAVGIDDDLENWARKFAQDGQLGAGTDPFLWERLAILVLQRHLPEEELKRILERVVRDGAAALDREEVAAADAEIAGDTADEAEERLAEEEMRRLRGQARMASDLMASEELAAP